MNPDVILGGGVAGLSAAYLLAQGSPRPVILLERNDSLGGLATTYSWEGCRIDLGPHRIFTILPGIERFVLDLLGDEVLRVKRQSSIHLKGRFIDYPVSFKEILSGLGPVCATRIGLSYAFSLLTSFKHFRSETPSYEDYISSRFGSYLYNLLFRDYAAKVWQEDPGNLSADMAKIRLAAPNLFASALEAIFPSGKTAVVEFLYPQGGIGRLSEKIAEKICAEGGKIQCRSEVQSIIIEEGRVKTIIGENQEGRFEIEPERVISTLPIPLLFKAMQPSAPSEILQAVDQLPFANSILVYVLFNQSQVRPDHWLYFPDPDILFTRSYEVDNFDRNNVPEGQSCLCFEIPCREEDEIWNRNDEDITHRVKSDMTRVGLGDSEKIIKTRTIRLKHVYPIYYRDYQSKLESLTSFLSTIQNLVSTGRGGLFCYNNSDHSIDMGLLAAEFLLSEHRDGVGTERFYQLRPRFEQYRIVD